MELSIVALAGIPAVSSLILDVAAVVSHRPAPPVAPVALPAAPPEPEPAGSEADGLERQMAARMWLRSEPRPV